MKKAKKTRVIPGYHLTFGIVITLLSLIVLIPLASVLVYALKLSPGEWFRLIMKENVRNAFLTSVGCSFLAAVINTVFGLILAWTLVKYEFPGKKLLDGFIELPFALPTAVAGITLSKLFTDSGFYGKIFAKLGIRIAYTKAGLVIALIFVGIPFVVRAVQPVLEKMDGQYEEAWRKPQENISCCDPSGVTTGTADRIRAGIRQRHRRVRKCHLHIGKQREGQDAGHLVCDHAEAWNDRL